MPCGRPRLPPRSSRAGVRGPGRSRSGRAAPAVSAFEEGVRLLARRAHSRVELARKLARRGHPAEDVAAALARLSERGLLDDAAFAEGHVRRRSVGRGPLALSAELAARGVSREVAGAALSRLAREDQLAAATAIAERLCAAKRPAGYRELLDRVGAGLLRRGFSTEIARAACAAAWSRTGGSPQA